MKKNASEKQFEFRTSQSEQPYFVIKAANGEIIGTSQMYKRMAGCEKGARSVATYSVDAPVEVV